MENTILDTGGSSHKPKGHPSANILSNTTEHPDQKYVNAIVSRDRILIEEIYKRLAEKIKWMVMRNSGYESDAKDVFQNALLSIFNQAKDGKFTLTCPFDAFFYTVCRNKWLTELAKRKIHKVTFFDPGGYSDLKEECTNFSDEFQLRQARKELIEEIFSKLGRACKILLQMSWQGKRMDEVARDLNVTYGYARKKKSECMAKLIGMVKASPKFDSLKW